MALAHRAERIDVAANYDQALVSAWRRLALLRENPFLTPDWFRVALQVLPGALPYVIAWWVGDEICGVLPLVATTIGPIRVLQFPNSRRGDWFGPACLPEHEALMAADVAALLEREGDWNALRFDRLDLDSQWPQALVDGDSKLTLAPRRRCDVLPYISFGEGGYEAYLAGRSRNFRSQLGRRRRKLEREHGLSFRMTADATELDADLTTFFDLHDERWRKRGGSTMNTPRSRELLCRFARVTHELGWLRLWFAEVDGKPGAAWYGWRVGDRYCYSLSGLSERYERDGLGTVLLAHTIEQAAAEGASTYDLMWGDEGYKKRFETGRRDVGTWWLSGGAPSRAVVSTGVRSALALESLPPAVRRPLGKVKRSLRRS